MSRKKATCLIVVAAFCAFSIVVVGLLVVLVETGVEAIDVPLLTPWATATPVSVPTRVPARVTVVPKLRFTDAPRPTSTFVPTDVPTSTPALATQTEPFVFTGSGDSIVNLDSPAEAALIHIVGNAAGRHFAVKSYDSSGESIDLLVNTTDPYDGIRPFDFMAGEDTTRLEVSASGPWTIEILPLVTSIRLLLVQDTIEGGGDDVILLGGDPDLATISGNAAGKHFAVHGYNGGRNLLVNTTDAYEGTVILHKGTLFLEIKAVGPWSITVTER